MSRVGAALGSVLCVVLAATPAAAEDAGGATPSAGAAPAIGQQTPGTVLCQVSNKDLDHVTGIAMGPNGTIYAVESPSETGVVEVWTVNQSTCEATKKRYGSQPRNPQDVAVAADGSIWVLDIVDGRAWITFEKVADPSSSAAAVRYRAGKASADTLINGTALLLQADGSPIVIAATNSKGVLYRPNGQMQPEADTNLPPLTQLGEFTPVNTGTGSGFDRLLVSAAALSPDRSRVVVRTKADAYEFKVTDGDIAAAITTGTPAITPLPGEENGQSIAYSADGKTFLTLDGGENPKLRSYTPYVPPAPTQAAAPPGGGGLDFGDITNIALATGFLGLAAVIAGVVGIIRFRRRAELNGDEYGDDRDRPRPPRPRSGGGRAPVRVGGPPPGDGRTPDGYGRGPDGYDQGQGYGGGGGGGRSHAPSPGGGQVYGSSSGSGSGQGGGGGGQVYGSGQGGGQDYGGGGQSYAPSQGGGQVYGSGSGQAGGGGQSQGSGQGGGTVYGGGQSGGRTYGRPRRPDDEPPPRRGGYGHDDTP